MKRFLTETFNYTDWANRRLIEEIKKMPDPEKAIYLFSHLITSQNNWMSRINVNSNEPILSWFEPVYKLDELEEKWNESICKWYTLLETIPYDFLEKEIVITPKKGITIGVSIKDIAIQLNNHSIHHRAQIATLLRQQEIPPPFLDYIGRVWKRY